MADVVDNTGLLHLSSLSSLGQRTPLSPSFAFAISLFYTALYIAPFYLSPTLRHTRLQNRDHPSVIRARTRSVAIVCALGTLITSALLYVYTGTTSLAVLARTFGLWPARLTDLFSVLALTAILFSCSLYETLLIDGQWDALLPSALCNALWHDPLTFRNLVVAPLSEELVFRALPTPLWLLASVSPARIVFATPLVFGLAHLHHLAAFLQAHTPTDKRYPPARIWFVGLARSAFQFAYTSLFGFFATFVFLRTGSFWAVVVVHAFCNCLGVPRVWGRVGAAEWEGNESQLGTVWTVVYYALIPVGMVGFWLALWPFTESPLAMARL